MRGLGNFMWFNLITGDENKLSTGNYHYYYTNNDPDVYDLGDVVYSLNSDIVTGEGELRDHFDYVEMSITSKDSVYTITFSGTNEQGLKIVGSYKGTIKTYITIG